MTLLLAVDAMGGDLGPEMVIPGLALALNTLSHDVHFLLYGDGPTITHYLAMEPAVKKRSTVVHADTIVTNHTKPMSAVRLGKKSNLGMAIEAVRAGEAHAVVSAANTGAYMALSKVILKTLDGISRPAIPAVMPTTHRHGRTIVLDLGANVECSALNLVQFALMGEAFASSIFNIGKPTIGLLNVGSEEMKGHATVQEAFQQLREFKDLNFHGFVEGNDIMSGTTDVVVTDGFSGNIALKAIEGTVRFVRDLLKDSMAASWRGKLGYLIAKPAFKRIQSRSDPRLYNGAVFLGLRHIAVKSHGGADAFAFSKAIEVAVKMAKNNFIDNVQRRLSLVQSQLKTADVQTDPIEDETNKPSKVHNE